MITKQLTGNLTMFSRISIAALCLASGTVFAQWTDNTQANTPVGVAANAQVQPKIVATSDGGAYIAWFDNAVGGYDVRLQRLDAAGNAQWGPDGILVADRSFSSTQDYDLSIDSAGNAFLAYRADSSGTTEAAATLVAPSGQILWTRTASASGGQFIGSPKAQAVTDAYIVGWTQNGAVYLQRYDSAGAAQWSPALTRTASVGSLGLADLVAGGGGDVIASWIHYTGSNPILSNKHIYTQKFGDDGEQLWVASGNGAGRPVFTANSVQNGYFPTMLSDSAGGAVYAWYEVGAARKARVQRLDGTGAELFPSNGVPGDTLAGRYGISAAAAFDPATGSTYLFYTDTNTAQSQWGLRAQKFDAAGSPQWTADGREILPLSSMQNAQTTALSLPTDLGSGAVVFYNEQPSGTRLVGYGLDPDGNDAWGNAAAEVSGVISGKSRVAAASAADGGAMIVWSDARTDSGDVYAQRMNPDGTGGPGNPQCPADWDQSGGVDGDDIGAFFADWTAGNADIDESGGTDGDDITFFFERWTAGC